MTPQTNLKAREQIKRGDCLRIIWKNWVRPCKEMEPIHLIAFEDAEPNELVSALPIDPNQTFTTIL
jgi:hypothetical protein